MNFFYSTLSTASNCEVKGGGYQIIVGRRGEGDQLSLQRAHLSRRVANLLRGGVFLSGPIFLINTSAISDGVVYISLVNQRRTEWRVCYSSRGVVDQEKRKKKGESI